jgi:hypothetical protein
MASRSRAGSLTSGMTSSSSLEQSIRRELAEIAEAEAVVDAEVLELLVKIGAMEAPQSKGGDERAGKKLSTSTSSSKASTDFRSHIGKLREFAPCFEAMAQDSKRLSGQIDDCRVLSDRLSSMVRRLDVIQIRAQQALACTEDVLNLKTCRQGIEAALQEQKLQIAVGYVKMVHDIDPEVAKSSDDYGAVLQGERETKALVHEEFKRALEGSDIQTVIALCPTLQTLGLESEARDSFLEFMERNVFIAVSADACSVDGVTEPATGYAFALSNIFNTVFAIIQQYLPVVIEGMENSNGDIHFIRRLHARCVKEAGSVLKRYMKYRGLKELVGSLKSVNTSRSIVIADVHSILDEFTLMLQYCCSYSDFINSLTRSAETRTLKNSSKNDSRIVFSAAHENTFTKMVDELVNMYYLECEMWLIRHGVQSAIQTALIKDNFSGVGSQSSSGDLAQKEGTEDADSTWMDECFFVLQRCGLRAIATKNIQAACAVLHVVSDQLSGDVVKFVSTRLNHSVTKLTTALANEVAKFTKKEADSSSSSIGSAGAFAFKSAFSLASSLTSSQGSGAATAPADSGSDALSKDLLDGLNSCFTCTRYIHRLTQEVVQNGKSVFVSDSSTSAAPASRSSGAPHSDALAKLMVCRDDFEAANVAFKRVYYCWSCLYPFGELM